MSSSSLWTIDQETFGEPVEEFQNSWLFSPIVWDALLEKYMSKEIETPFGYKKNLLGPDGKELGDQLNLLINDSTVTVDRVCWELSNQQVFFARDRELVAKCIERFPLINYTYAVDNDNAPILWRSHVTERFDAIAAAIRAIDPEKTPYFVLKNTSVDDGVEYWFNDYDVEKDWYTRVPLCDMDESVTEFVNIEDGVIVGFTGNVDYFKQKGSAQHEATREKENGLPPI